ncbi:hypothetical protein NP493_180g00001 [Ridgeia piscesae]|uniref:Peptidase C51 domain-containing protein n=1 Tax=Ridgeia piscesae TaxID=27915 RepID=A0AAD9P2P0_RIDPI|nr:hypothetical protein NP493_180g00001 [Ridgeia piscesae]
MTATNTAVCLVLVVSFVQLAQCTRSDALATEAEKHLGSRQWSYFSIRKTGRPGRKCNIFVAEMIQDAGGVVPLHRSETWSPICAAEWSNPNSRSLLESGCWKHVTSPRRGDVAGFGGHVGIVTGPRSSIGASSVIADAVVISDWGFRPGHNPVYWRYTCPWNPITTSDTSG